ncbi:hypothetical protein HMPREF0063_10095 [Aeromicrobium marinum DSM 15272]|uniref:Helix-turn-helix domain-containing protein n=1 Tax=Aeromicrobium marinum DSM 15272 TaxID=585531 RepID=E2S7T8_9ACTN|nr:helix-turn-helix domain-containing protein [Aeromicrobium marinum]EFQ84754.1 hypothetical protein HMPREF0063_10095 [Aeromicrobium marinum DSM 15272]
MSVKPAMLTARDAATYLGLGLREVRRLVKAGELDIKYIGAKNNHEYRIVTASADAYIAALPSEPRRSA